MQGSAEAHGLAAYRTITDINVAYAGQWRPFVNGVQPEIVDAGYRGPSEERLLPAAGVVAQAYRGPLGAKQVFWERARNATNPQGEAVVWIDGVRSDDAARPHGRALRRWSPRPTDCFCLDRCG